MRAHKVDRCPHKWVSDMDLGSLFEAVDDAEHHLMPVAGGRLDQAQSFLDALRFVKQEKKLCGIE